MQPTQAYTMRMWKQAKPTISVHGMTPYSGMRTFPTNMCRSEVLINTACHGA